MVVGGGEGQEQRECPLLPVPWIGHSFNKHLWHFSQGPDPVLSLGTQADTSSASRQPGGLTSPLPSLCLGLLICKRGMATPSR